MTEILTPPTHPFDPTADPRRLYADAARRHLATATNSALSNGSKLIVIVGEQGAGKSSLLSQLAEQVTARSGIRFAFPHKILACKLDVAPEAIAKLIQTPGGATRERRPGPEGDSAAVLLLDDAEHLSGDVIESLLEQQKIAGSEGLSLVIVATMTPSSATGPDHKAFGRLTKGADPLLRLEPLSPEDAGRMIRHRLETSRYSEPNIFTPEAIDSVARTTGGNPGRIIGLCRAVMDTAERDHCYPILSVLVDDAASRDRRYRTADADPIADADPFEHRRDTPIVPHAMPMPTSASTIELAPSSTAGIEAEKHSVRRFNRVKTLATVAIVAILVAASAMIYLFAPEPSNLVGDARQQRADREEAGTTVAVETVAGNEQQKITEPAPEKVAEPTPERTSANEASGRESQPSAEKQPESGRAAVRAEPSGHAAPPPERWAPKTANRTTTTDRSRPPAVIVETSTLDDADSVMVERGPDDERAPGISVSADDAFPSVEEQRAAPKTETPTMASGRSDQPAVVSGTAKQSGNPSSKVEGPVAAPTTEDTLLRRDSTSPLRTAPAEPIAGPLTPANDKPETYVSLATEPDAKPDSEATSKRTPMDPDTLIARGDKLLSVGDLASARLVYRMAVMSGSGRAARFVGRTYDPLFFESAGIIGIQPSAPQAAEWYRKAEEMGDEEGARRLEELRAWLEKGASNGDAEAIRAHDSLR